MSALDGGSEACIGRRARAIGLYGGHVRALAPHRGLQQRDAAGRPGAAAGGGEPVGWVRAGLRRQRWSLGAAEAAGMRVALRSAQLAAVRRALAAAGVFRWRGEAFDVRARAGRAGAGAGRPRRAAGVRHRAQRGACERAGGGGGTARLWVARRAADKALDRRQARSSGRGRRAGRADAGGDAGQGGGGGSRPAGGAGAAGPAGRRHRLCDGAAGGAAAGPAALLRPGAAGGFRAASRRTARSTGFELWRAGRACSRRCARPTSSSSTSTWC